MTNKLAIQSALIGALIMSSISGCSTFGGKKEEATALNGPAVIDARVNPKTVELDRELNPIQRSEILTEVKDFKAPITEVRLRFEQVPIEIPMKNIGGTTWRAELSSKDIRRLAVGNQTTVYSARIIAKDKMGDVAMSKDPVQVAIKAPDLAKASS